MDEIKRQFGIPVFCLMRDTDNQSYQSTFKEGFKHE